MRSADAPAAETLDVLSALVGKSLVTKEETKGLACYRLHETMREFARLKLAEAVEEEATELRCAGYYRARCAQSAREGRYRLLDWLAWADLEIDNVRAVLRRCLDRGDAATGLHLSASLGWYWITRATSEGIRWLDEFLAAKDTADADPQVLGWAQFMRGFLAVLKADPAAAGPPPGRRCTRRWRWPARRASANCCPKRCPWPRSWRTWPATAAKHGACSARPTP